MAASEIAGNKPAPGKLYILFHPRQWNLRQREAAAAYAFISPWIVGFIIFTLGPMLASFYFSFTEYNILDPPVWTGIDNYRTVFFEDPLFWHSLSRTIYFAALALPFSAGVGT